MRSLSISAGKCCVKRTNNTRMTDPMKTTSMITAEVLIDVNDVAERRIRRDV